MSDPENKPRVPHHWKRISDSLGSKLLLLLVSSMALAFGVLGYLNIALHRKHLERTAIADAARMSSVIKRNTSYLHAAQPARRTLPHHHRHGP